MNNFQDYMLSELKKRFEQLAAIDSWTLSWEDGKTQVELMIELAQAISHLERRKHHHHHQHPQGKPEASHENHHHAHHGFHPFHHAPKDEEVLIVEEVDIIE